jgi:hypothetical protein
MRKIPTANNTFAIGEVKYSAETFVVNQSLVLSINPASEGC